MSKEKSCVIVGGGIGGLAAALALARQGIRSQVIEQASDFKEVGAGIQLGPNAFQMFDKLGITDDVAANAVYPESLVLMDAESAELVTSMPLDRHFIDRFGKPYAVIHRADLHSALLHHCRVSGLVEETTSTKIIDVNQDDDKAVVKSGDGQSFEGDVVVGADGLWSTIRASLVHDGSPRLSGHIAYRAVLPMDRVPEKLRTNSMRLWAGPKFHLVQYPLRGGRECNLVAVFHSQKYEEGWNAFGDREELHLRFKRACPQVKELLSLIDEWRMWVLCDREPIHQWSSGRVTLLGDAAHPTLQYLAQGACMAIEDAVCLAGQLANASSADTAHALVSYQEQRYLRTARVQLMARIYGMAYHAEGATRDLRNDVLRKRTVEQGHESLAWLYDYELEH
jgi:2-polyprenyl-6-methoxyphenol hydroxylase-like FAD-dependent oxidoreductase